MKITAVTPAGFRRIALGLTGVVERSHQGHADFRVAGRILASLGYPDKAWGMLVLTPDQQRSLVRTHPDGFLPVKGKWGEQGCTSVRLAAVDEEMLGEALTLAWQHASARQTGARRPTNK